MKAGKIIAGIILAAGIGAVGWGVWKYMQPPVIDGDKPPLPPATPNPDHTNTTTVTPPTNTKPPQNVPIVPKTTVMTSGFRIGQYLYAQPTTGTNVYKSAAAGVSTLYKHYAPYYFIGTYLSTQPGYIKIAIDNEGMFETTAQEVYVLEGQVFGTK